MTSKGVFIIGLGIVSPFGFSKDDFWRGLNNPASHTMNCETYQSTSLKNRGKKYYYKRVNNFSASSYYSEKELYKLDRNSEFVVVAAKLALQDSGVDLAKFSDREKGVCVGTSASIAASMSDFDESVLVNGPRRCDVGIFPSTVMCAPASRISILESIKGMNITVSSGRNSGLDAVGYAFMDIKSGFRKLMLAGGTDALLPKIMIGYENEGLLIEVNSEKAEFQSKRGSFIPSEGACILVLRDGNSADSGLAYLCRILSFNSNFSPCEKRNRHERCESLLSNMSISLDEAELQKTHVHAVLISSYYDLDDFNVEVQSVQSFFPPNVLEGLPVLSYKKALGENFATFGAEQIMIATGVLNDKVSLSKAVSFNINPYFKTLMHRPQNIMVINVDSAGHNSVMVVTAK